MPRAATSPRRETVPLLSNHHQLRARRVVVNRARHRGRGTGILLAADHQHRAFDFLQPPGEVDLGNRVAAADVARHRRRSDQRADPAHNLRVRFTVRLGKPALERGLNQRLHALRLGDTDALGPDRSGFRREVAGGVGEHEALKHARILERERLPDHAAHRQAGEVRALDAELVEQSL
jgi:hypothetical protein